MADEPSTGAMSPAAVRSMAADPALTEDAALALLKDRDLPGEAIAAMAANTVVMKNRRVLRALVAHPRAPRHISLPRTRHLYTFELMEMALSPAVAADVKLAGEEVILTRLETITVGERVTLAKRASTRIAAELLRDADERVMQAALANSRITEASVVRAIQHQRVTEALVHAVCRHPEWSLRRDVQIALLRNPHTPLPRALYFISGMPAGILTGLLGYVRVELKYEIMKELERRKERRSK
jgi:hypothetical protein